MKEEDELTIGGVINRVRPMIDSGEPDALEEARDYVRSILPLVLPGRPKEICTVDEDDDDPRIVRPGAPDYPKTISSDQHLCESGLFKLRGRQQVFQSVQQQNDLIIARHNELVGKDDWCWFVGDAVWQEAGIDALKILEEMKGHKVLFRGNHDDAYSDAVLLQYFEEIVPAGKGKILVVNEPKLDINNRPLFTQHYPMCGRLDMFNLVGHVHHVWKVQLNMLNVGVDCNHFYPLLVADLPFNFNAIVKFFDRDIFAAFDPLNLLFDPARGQKSDYFHKTPRTGRTSRPPSREAIEQWALKRRLERLKQGIESTEEQDLADAERDLTLVA